MAVRKQLLVAILSFVVGGALAVAKPAQPKVAPLSASDRALTKCPLHGTALQSGSVRIAYGLIKGLPGFFEAKKKAFPYANSVVLGGCLVSKDSPTTEEVKFCPQCRAAQKRWLVAHKAAPYFLPR